MLDFWNVCASFVPSDTNNVILYAGCLPQVFDTKMVSKMFSKKKFLHEIIKISDYEILYVWISMRDMEWVGLVKPDCAGLFFCAKFGCSPFCWRSHVIWRFLELSPFYFQHWWSADENLFWKDYCKYAHFTVTNQTIKTFSTRSTDQLKRTSRVKGHE